MERLVNLFEFEAAALARLPAGVRDHYQGGAADEITLRDNRAAWERWRIHYRTLRDVSRRDPSTELLGARLEFPLVVAPTAFQAMANEAGECATARAAAAYGVPMVLSTLSNRPMEEVATHATRGLWFQLYVYRDRGITRELVARARTAGCRALVLTVDAPLGGPRERDLRNEFSYPPELPFSNVLPAAPGPGQAVLGEGGFVGYVSRMFDPSLRLGDLEWIAAEAGIPVLVKGVVRADDAAAMIRHGARGVIVSNHGGRQLDTAPATADVLESIVQAVAADVPVLVDGGVRRGTDVLKALALGARAVLLGRPVLWGLAVGGEAGVRRVLELLRHEFDIAMALAGCATLADVDRSLVAPTGQLPPASARPR